MSGFNRRVVLASLLGLGAISSMVSGVERTPIPITAPTLRRSKRSIVRAGSGNVIRWGYGKWMPQTVAQNKRAAIKAKNRIRHRSACRGAA